MIRPLVLAALLAIPFAINAQPGTLDPTFDVDGKVTTDLGFATYDEAFAIAIQADGAILAAGTSGYSGTQDFAVVRYLTDGSPDLSFGSGGVSLLSVVAADDIGRAMLIQPDSAILVAGYVYDPGGIAFGIARFLYDGTPDPAFGAGGSAVTLYPGDATSQARSIALQSDGKIVVAGGGSAGFAVVRFNTDGSVDSTFGAGGLVTIDFSEGNDQATGIAVLPDDRILLAGYASGLTSDSIAIARLEANGALDATFTGGGKFRTSYPTLPSLGRALYLMPDGRFVVAGDAQDKLFVARFLPDGQPDLDFNVFGMRLITVPGASTVGLNSVRVRDDGKVVAAGGAFFLTFDMLVVQLNDDGSFDAGFGTNGIVSTNFYGTLDRANGIAVQNDGALVLAGVTSGISTDYDFSLARYSDVLTTALPETTLATEVSAFPVPLASALTIDFNMAYPGSVSIDLMDLRGAQVQHLFNNALCPAGPQRVTLDVDPSIAPGPYALVVRTALSSTVLKVVR